MDDFTETIRSTVSELRKESVINDVDRTVTLDLDLFFQTLGILTWISTFEWEEDDDSDDAG